MFNIKKLFGLTDEGYRDFKKGVFATVLANLTLFIAFAVIIIAHRLSTVRGADQILVIDGGRVVEQGRHDELVKAGGRYSRMWEQYTGAIRWKLGTRSGLSQEEALHV